MGGRSDRVLSRRLHVVHEVHLAVLPQHSLLHLDDVLLHKAAAQAAQRRSAAFSGVQRLGSLLHETQRAAQRVCFCVGRCLALCPRLGYRRRWIGAPLEDLLDLLLDQPSLKLDLSLPDPCTCVHTGRVSISSGGAGARGAGARETAGGRNRTGDTAAALGASSLVR